MTGSLEDREAIRDLLSDYCVCMDNGRFGDMAALFVADGVWQDAVGRSEIEARVGSIVPAPDQGPRRIHFMSNIVIRIDGTEAKATSNWVVIRTSAHGAAVGAAGTYVDDLTKQNGRWLFRHRRISEDIPGDLGLKPR